MFTKIKNALGLMGFYI